MTQAHNGHVGRPILVQVVVERQAVLVVALLAILAATLSLNSPPAAQAQETSPISLEVEARL